MEIEPSWAEAWLTLGRARRNLGEVALAISAVERAHQIDASNTEASEELAELHTIAASLISKGVQDKSEGKET